MGNGIHSLLAHRRQHIEWRADDHVIMTGPDEWEWSSTLDPATGAFDLNDIEADVL